MNRSWFLCRLSGVVLLSEESKTFMRIYFCPNIMPMVYVMHNVLKSAYYALSEFLDRAFGPIEQFMTNYLSYNETSKNCCNRN